VAHDSSSTVQTAKACKLIRLNCKALCSGNAHLMKIPHSTHTCFAVLCNIFDIVSAYILYLVVILVAICNCHHHQAVTVKSVTVLERHLMPF
jgi:hypothetical protein